MFPIDDPKQAMRYETAARLSAFLVRQQPVYREQALERHSRFG